MDNEFIDVHCGQVKTLHLVYNIWAGLCVKYRRAEEDATGTQSYPGVCCYVTTIRRAVPDNGPLFCGKPRGDRFHRQRIKQEAGQISTHSSFYCQFVWLCLFGRHSFSRGTLGCGCCIWTMNICRIRRQLGSIFKFIYIFSPESNKNAEWIFGKIN